MPRGPLRSRIFLTSLAGRLPVGAVGLLLILRTREITGSFAAGGAVAGANALALGVAAPAIGRLIDRRGQAVILVAGGTGFAVAMGAFALLPDGAPLGWALGLAALAGACQPPLGSALRAIWTRELRDARARHRAFTFESTVFELVYIVGPLLFVTGIGAWWSLAGAAGAAAAITLAGAVAFAASPASRGWRPDRDAERHLLGGLRSPGVRVLLGAFLLFGVTVAAIEMGVVAFLEARDERAALGPVLAAWGLASMAGGLVAARARAPRRPWRRMALLFGGMAAGALPLALAAGTVSLGTLLLLSGAFIAPALSLAFATVGQVAPPGTITESYTWSTTGIGAGVAGGAAVAGVLVERSGPDGAFLLGAAAAALAGALLAGAGRAATSVPAISSTTTRAAARVRS